MAVSNVLLLPGTMDTVRALLGMLGDGGFYLDALATIARCLVAMLLALVLGFVLSVESYRHHIVRDILSLPVPEQCPGSGRLDYVLSNRIHQSADRT